MRPQSTQYGLPLFLEDSTGILVKSHFTDLYDRLQLSLTATPHSTPNHLQLAIRILTTTTSSTHRKPATPDAFISLPLASFRSATVAYGTGPAIPVESYLRRRSNGGRSFVGSDGQTYTWTCTQTNPGDLSTVSWMCEDGQGTIVAEYAGNDPEVTGSRCAAVMTVEEGWNNMVLELLTTLTIVRYAAQNRV